MRPLCAVAVLLIGLFHSCFASELGQLPEGYTWHEDETLGVAIPVPKGWHIKRDQSSGTRALLLTKEDIDVNGRFSTGYGLNFVDKFSRRHGGGPTKYAVAFIRKMQQENGNIVIEPWVTTLAPGVTAVGIRYRDSKEAPILVHYFLIADELRDSLRIMSFEAPEATWHSAWKHGELMLSRGAVLADASESAAAED